MLKEYKLNYGLSKDIFYKYKESFEINKCYNNIFNLVSSNYLEDISVVYGFVYREDIQMFTRHCFILDSNDTVVDPTTLFWSGIDILYSSILYYPIDTYSLSEYVSILDENKGGVELYNQLLKEEIALHNQLISKGYQRNYAELGEFLQRIYGKNLYKGIKEYQENKGIIKRIE